MLRRYFAVMGERPSDLPAGDRFRVRKLGLKKTSAWACHNCSKKTPGRPKQPRGTCGLGMDRSPKKGRNRWRLEIGLFD